jgi:hypothetical protein
MRAVARHEDQIMMKRCGGDEQVKVRDQLARPA